eukprot:Awhi_evm1s718
MYTFPSFQNTGLDTLLRTGDNQISGGQKQRLCLVRLFLSGILGKRHKRACYHSQDDAANRYIIGPEIVLLDEITSALDVQTQTKILENLK